MLLCVTITHGSQLFIHLFLYYLSKYAFIYYIYAVVTSFEISDGPSGNRAGFSASFFSFPLFIAIPPLIHIHLSPASMEYDSRGHTAQYGAIQLVDYSLLTGHLADHRIKVIMRKKYKQANFLTLNTNA